MRRQRGLTREQLGVLAECSYNMIVKIDRGECKPSLTLLGRLARALDCSVADFFDEDDPDLSASDDPRPSDLGAEVDAWIASALPAMPYMTEEIARKVSAVLFRASASKVAPESRSGRRSARAS
jgi:transcriptional regulator with XRE-family HTH domain